MDGISTRTFGKIIQGEYKLVEYNDEGKEEKEYQWSSMEKWDKAQTYLIFKTPEDKAEQSGIVRITFVDKRAREELSIRIVYKGTVLSLMPMLDLSLEPPLFSSDPITAATRIRLESNEEPAAAEVGHAEPNSTTIPELLYQFSKRALKYVKEEEVKIKRRKLDNSRVRIGNEVVWRASKLNETHLRLEISYSYWSFEDETEVLELMQLFLNAANMRP